MTSEALQKEQSFLDYTLKDHIGDGGYGEVWTAEAPGGLMKAIKFIYGFHDEARAQREFKSLNHIKQLRHPFLLSLERIDVVDGRLVIVTELADKCLSDRYDECVAEGLGGIPRKELIGYIKETADALDYIGNAHSLQHLDIKPENILLLSGHVKVADFGLVKDIQDCTQSVMGGLTPAYAAPELFDGRPTGMSDQYSLAIVYQEMLTGERPFTGTTPAQLAAQHIHGRPNLRPLPRGDQAAIAKALSKDPQHRYPSCTALAEDLFRGEHSEEARLKPTRTRKTRQNDECRHEHTVVIGNLPTSRSSENVVKLPPLDFSPDDARIHPTLLVGVGGMGTRILRDVKERFHDRVAPPDALPAFRFLAVDVDQDDLYAASRSRSSRGLSDMETLEIPLRRPDQYRNDKSLDLTWLSRRWIYNIPRSRKTEGIRPLGRLAFVDNSERFHDRLGKVISPFRDEANLGISAEKIGIDPDPKPRAYVVGSVSGGVGSGTIIDMAYSIRWAFAELGQEDIEVIGILIHGAGRTCSVRSLAAANTYAFLRELNHIRKNGYPGDEASSIPSFEPDVPPFDSTYLVHMGEDQAEGQFRQRTESLAEYIYLDCATVCNSANKVARDTESKDEDCLRTFGLANIDIAVDSSSEKLQRLLKDHLIKRWTSESDGGFDYEATIRKLRANLQLSPSNIFDIVRSEVHQITGLDPFDLAGEVARNAGRIPLNENNVALVPEEITSSVRGWFHTEHAGVNGHTVSDRAVRSLARLAKEKVEELESLIALLVDQPGFRLAKVLNSVDEFERTVKQFAESASQFYDENAAELRAHEEAWSSPEVLENDTALQDSIGRFTHTMARDELLMLVMNFVQYLLAETQSVGGKVKQISSRLNGLAVSLPKNKPHANEDYDDGFTYQVENYLIGEIASNAPRLVEQLDDCLQQTYLDHTGGFWTVLTAEDNRDIRALNEAIANITRQLVQTEISQIDIDDVIRARRIDEGELVDWVRPSVEDATPYILDCGGETRMLVNVPQMSSGDLCRNALEVIFDESPTVVRGTSGTVSLCFEVQRIPVANIALRLIEDAPEAGECVGRLDSRTDVDWDPLTGIA